LDIRAALAEINQHLVGQYVVNIYDIDNKTYLIKLRTSEDKKILLFESGMRVHMTEMEWPKSNAPSGFSMKMRKHLKGKRLVSAQQLGFDRVIDLQFGNRDEFAFHLIIEFYDRGNVILTDSNYQILNLLRQRTDEKTDEKYAVREVYPIHSATQLKPPMTSIDQLTPILAETEGPTEGQKKKKQKKQTLSRKLNYAFGYGVELLEHFLSQYGAQPTEEQILATIQSAHDFLNDKTVKFKGFITTAESTDTKGNQIVSYTDYLPFKFNQLDVAGAKMLEFARFSQAVDNYYGQIQTQKSEQKMLQAERAALKKFENVKADHVKRLENLQISQESNKNKGQLIEMNLDLVDTAIHQVRSAIASQIDWDEIGEMLQEAQEDDDPVASAIKELQLKTNHIVMFLCEPSWELDSSDSDDDDDSKPLASRIQINLELSAYGNAKYYYDSKKEATRKEMKTIDATKKALKSAEKKTIESLKDIEIVKQVSKARKTLWFEKFIWFISSENYLVIAGRDAQQNELIVKKHLRPGDVYIHGDIHGASSCVVKNHLGVDTPISPVSLTEAGHAAVCFSAAWEAKVVTSAWWVHAAQVSKTAPSGEYLTTGSFMIRGKKNYLPPSHLIMGIGVLFKLDETCVAKHQGERKVKGQANLLSDQVDEELIEKGDDDGDEIKIDYSKAIVPDEEVIYMGDDKPIIVKFAKPEDDDVDGRRKQQAAKKERAKPAWKLEKEAKQSEQRAKRGAKSKQKKIKEKYGDQDEEDREAAMALLHGSGGSNKKTTRKGKYEFKKDYVPQQKRQSRGKAKVKEPKEGNVFQRAEVELAPPEEIEATEETSETPKEPVPVEEDDEDVDKLLEEEGYGAEGSLLDMLTGKPDPEDILHFAIPVVAPYGAVKDYKYHLKMTPGTGKKGKSAKQAQVIFCGLKESSERESQLIKAAKEEDMTRNMPGKVKLSGAHVNQKKKK